ncbi:tol-pal system protein YbgF [Thalassobius sp. S69A]|uniref:tol-pal system protein YbgF n=1 Tax=unclassified Thalassovita TaxID=2619711 RepID=UPI000C455FED|nr:tol-pal system protein YbgF [Paracoccaceae bacterium]
MRWIFAVLLMALLLPMGPRAGLAQDRTQTLADIRQELSVLYVEIQRLKRELSTSGAPAGAGGGSVLSRVNAIEAQMQQLTSKTEQLEFRINRIVQDGTNRIGDLEFRLVELEGGDVSKLGDTTTLGGADQGSPAPARPEVNGGSDAQLAVGEQADFDAARAALENGDASGAAQKFAAFIDAYPGSPLTASAHLLRGKALSRLGDNPGAARAFLNAFSSAPQGTDAPEALFLLGQALADLGQTQEACVTLSEVGVRFPTSASVEPAQVAMQQLGCS